MSEQERKVYERDKFPILEETAYPNTTYAINAEWMRTWEDYRDRQRDKSYHPPGEISNLNIYNSLEQYKSLNRLREKFDYFIVSKE